MSNTDVLQQFYTSFSKGDAEGMVRYYHDDIVFHDPAFGKLKGEDAKNMWRMLIKNSKGNLKISFRDISADEKYGSAKWIAEYVFSKTGRPVINKISAEFEFQDGKIIRHVDHFNLWNWSRQALGLSGYILGWTPIMKNKIQKQTKLLLEKFHASE